MRTWFLIGALFAIGGTASADDPAPDGATLSASAKVKLEAGDAKGAAEDLTKALALAPTDAALLHERARCRARLGDVKGTVEDIREAAAASAAEHPMDLKLWRTALENSRTAGGSKEPDLTLIQAEIEEIRGKKFKADVPSGTQSQEEFGKMVAKGIDQEMPKARRADTEAGLHRLGLLPEGFDFEKEVAGALKSQAAAYYEPKEKKFFNLFTDVPASFVEAIAAHELVHGLQDQYHDLTHWFDAAATRKGVRDDDRVLAMRCVVEGEAQYVAMVWQMRTMMHMETKAATAMMRMALPMVANMDAAQLMKLGRKALESNPRALNGSEAILKSMDEAEKIEPYVMESLLAAYMSGANFIGNVQAGGWDAVDALYEAPPTSSEQCLHPAKFTKKRDLPTPVATPDLPEIAAAGWREADAAVHGELYFRVLLRRNGVKTSQATSAAAGWDGDLYRAWRAADGRTAIVLVTTWDTEKDAQEFFDAYRSALAKKYEKLVAEAVQPAADAATPPTPAAPAADPSVFRYSCGDAALGTGDLRRRGLEVFAVEGFSAELRAQVVEKLVAAKIEHVE